MPTRPPVRPPVPAAPAGEPQANAADGGRDAEEPLPGGPAGASPALVRALRQVLRPLVKLMLARGITYPYLSDLLKGLFVEVAERDFRLDGKRPTDSRVSLVSGVHRKDVSRLRQLTERDEITPPAVVTLGSQLVSRWMGHPLYQTEHGQPMPLARLSSEGGELSFESLVSSVNSDIRSRVVLDEWLRLGVVHIDEAGRVQLNAAAFVPSQGADEKAHYLGLNLADHANASVHNLLGGLPPFMERSVHYTALSARSVEQLTALSEQMGMKALLAVNQAAMAAEAEDAAASPPGDASRRITFGVYFYAEPMAEPETPAATPPEPTP